MRTRKAVVAADPTPQKEQVLQIIIYSCRKWPLGAISMVKTEIEVNLRVWRQGAIKIKQDGEIVDNGKVQNVLHTGKKANRKSNISFQC